MPAGARLHIALQGGRSVVRASRSGLPLGLRQLHGWTGAGRGEPGASAVRVAVVQTGAMIVGGDDVHLDVEVGPGAALILQDISATLAHPAAAGTPVARQRLSIRVAAGGCAVIAEEPVVVARGARLERTVLAELESDARLVHRETLVLGRHGEGGGELRARTRVQRDGRPLLDDGLATGGCTRAGSPAVLGGARVLATVAAFGLGAALERPGDAFLLAGGDVLLRRLGPDVRSLHATGGWLGRWGDVALGAPPGGGAVAAADRLRTPAVGSGR